MRDKTLEMTMLLDFYGELLTEKQRECFDSYYNEDMSLAELAEVSGVSRQGVRDLLVRTENTLRDFEQKIGLVERHLRRQEQLQGMKDTLVRLEELSSGEAKDLAADLRVRLAELENG